MKKTHQLLIVLLLIAGGVLSAQIKGTIIDKDTRQPIAFVNIGWIGKGIGTLSNENGTFSLKENAATDTLQISVLGYKRISCTAKDYEQLFAKTNYVIALSAETFSLNEVLIWPRHIEYKTTGNTTKTRSIHASFSSNDLGSEIGVPMTVKKNRRCLIDTLCFNINDCRFDSVQFRVNIYTFRNGKPDSSLLFKPLYVVSKNSFTTLRVDVTALQLEVSGDFFVSLEWLRDLGKDGLTFPAGLGNTHAYIRNASQGNWEKIPVGVGFYCKTRQEKTTKKTK